MVQKDQVVGLQSIMADSVLQQGNPRHAERIPSAVTEHALFLHSRSLPPDVWKHRAGAASTNHQASGSFCRPPHACVITTSLWSSSECWALTNHKTACKVWEGGWAWILFSLGIRKNEWIEKSLVIDQLLATLSDFVNLLQYTTIPQILVEQRSSYFLPELP